MSLTIAAAAPAAHYQPRPASPPPAPPPPAPPAAQATAAATTTTSSAQQQANLARLLDQYTAEQTQGTAANTLSTLGRQITAAAQAIPQQVTLPSSPAAPATPPVAGSLNLTV